MKKTILTFYIFALSFISFGQWTLIITDPTGDTGDHDATLLEYQYDDVADIVKFRITSNNLATYSTGPAADFSFQLPFGLDSGAPAGTHWSSTTPVHKTAYIYCDAGGSAPSSYTYIGWPLRIDETSSSDELCSGCVSILADVASSQITYTFNRTDIITDTEMGGETSVDIGLVANLGHDIGWDDAITHESGGASAATFNITIPSDELTALFTPESSTICNSTSLTFTDASSSPDAGGITAWNWTFDGGTPATASTEGPHTVNYPTPGTYNATLEVTDAIGTHDTTFVITVTDCDDLFASFVPENTTICEGDCISFTNESTGSLISTWSWAFSDPDIAGPILTEDPGTVCFPNEGSHTITLTIGNDLFSDDTTITITVNPAPIISASQSPEGPHCIGDEVILTGTGATSYSWTDGIMDGIAFSPSETTTYTVTGTDDLGCTATSDITVSIISCEPIIAGFTYTDNRCIGDCQTLSDATIGGPVSWTWDFGGAAMPNTSTEQNPMVCFDTPGVYNIQLTATNISGESSSTINSITVFALPIVSASPDSIIDIGGKGNLIASAIPSGGTYSWAPDYRVDCETCPATWANPDEATLYTVTYSDINGCSASDEVEFHVNFFEAVGVPSAFSPNNDGANDVLYVKGYGLESLRFAVYNRYGELVFESMTQDIGWDGTFLNRDLVPGVYTWVLEYQLLNGRNGSQKGNTTLIR